jgi:hypothetical protein
MESIMQRAFLVVRSVGLSSLAGLGLILVFVFASNSFAVTTPWMNQQRKLKAAAAASAAREASAVDSVACLRHRLRVLAPETLPRPQCIRLL